MISGQEKLPSRKVSKHVRFAANLCVLCLALGATLFVSGEAAGQDNAVAPKSKPSLDRFDENYGFPTFPRVSVQPSAHTRVRQVPNIFYGGDVQGLRLNDVPKIPIDAPPPVHPI